MSNFNPFSSVDFNALSLSAAENWYLQFLNNFPPHVQPIISLVLAFLIIYSVFRVVRKDWIFIIALVVLVPGSRPILLSIWQGLVEFIKFLFGLGHIG